MKTPKTKLQTPEKFQITSSKAMARRRVLELGYFHSACGKSYRWANKLTMLYDRWRQIARENRNELALRDALSGRYWTFRQLDAVAESRPAESGPVVYPQGISAEFIFTVLRAWKARQVVCPLEAGQTPPQFARLPKGCVHLKTTSATTGAPRFIAFTAEQLMDDAENIVAAMGLRRDWPNLAAISLAHSYG